MTSMELAAGGGRALTVSAFGMHLHAATTVEGRDRKQLERVCRYLLRPHFAHDAVQALPDGRVRVHFKAPWRSALKRFKAGIWVRV